MTPNSFFDKIAVNRWTGCTGPVARISLVVAMVAALALPTAAVSAAVVVAGTSTTTKAGQADRVGFVLVNPEVTPALLHFAVTLPDGMTSPAGHEEDARLDPGDALTVTVEFAVARGLPVGARDITLAWTDATSGANGVAHAEVLVTPYDSWWPTLRARPDPLILDDGATGSAVSLAGCLTDAGDGTLVPWFITQCPWAYRTRVESLTGGPLVSVAPGSGPLDIPDGAPTSISQLVTPPAVEGGMAVDVVTLELDAHTPAGLLVDVARARYIVIHTRAVRQLVPVRRCGWGEIKAQFGGPPTPRLR